MLSASIRTQRDHCSIDIRLNCEKGKLLVLTGPSGSGKTTAIRALAGLERPDSGRIVHDNRLLFDSTQNIWVPARKRKVGYVFQEHTLFPHLNVKKNILFSCKQNTRADALLQMLGISHLSTMKPHQISGGERQRAAMAQALASDPQILLLDEPFSALDTTTRVRLRQELKQLQSRLNIPVILVTHDLEEAAYLADTTITLPCPAVPTTEKTAPAIRNCNARLQVTPALT